MADDLTADDLRALAGLWREVSTCRGYPGIEDRAERVADLMDQGWRFTLQPVTVSVDVRDLRTVVAVAAARAGTEAEARPAVDRLIAVLYAARAEGQP